MSILVVMEQRAVQGPPAWSRMSWETLAAGQQLARELQQPVSAAVLGQGIEGLASELTEKKLDHVYAVEHDLLKDYTPDTYTARCASRNSSSGLMRLGESCGTNFWTAADPASMRSAR